MPETDTVTAAAAKLRQSSDRRQRQRESSRRIAACRREARTTARPQAACCRDCAKPPANRAAVRKPLWPWVRLTKTAVKPSASGSQRLSFAHSGMALLRISALSAQRYRISVESCQTISAAMIRQQRQRRRHQKKERRIMPAIKRRGGAEQRLLIVPLGLDVEDRRGVALQGRQRPRHRRWRNPCPEAGRHSHSRHAR